MKRLLIPAMGKNGSVMERIRRKKNRHGLRVSSLKLTCKIWLSNAYCSLRMASTGGMPRENFFPSVKNSEIVSKLFLFSSFVEFGVALLASDFLQGLLYYYGIQIHHLNPESILHIAVYLCFFAKFSSELSHTSSCFEVCICLLRSHLLKRSALLDVRV